MASLLDKLKSLKQVKIGLNNVLAIAACCLLFVVVLLLFQIAAVSSDILASIQAAQENSFVAAAEGRQGTFELLNEVKEIGELTCEVASNTDKIGQKAYDFSVQRTCGESTQILR